MQGLTILETLKAVMNIENFQVLAGVVMIEGIQIVKERSE
jgi:hypothetical protein